MFSFFVVLSFFLDRGIGDPPHWIHPVQVMGWIITLLQNLILRTDRPLLRKPGGVGLALGLIGGSGCVVWGLTAITGAIHPFLSGAMIIIITASTLASKSLRQASDRVLEALSDDSQEDLALARTKLGYVVGRDTAQLDRTGILRAILETVAENAVDGVTAPLFYAIVGMVLATATGQLFWLAALPLGYKAASTLDSMVGYQREPYRDLGWASAKIEDGLTWFPCRLTVITLALLSGKPRAVLRVCRRDGPQDPSPNSGWSEAVYAAILGVQLGGVNYYQGTAIVKPLLGDNLKPITPTAIHQAHHLTFLCCLSWLGTSLIAMLLLGLLP